MLGNGTNGAESRRSGERPARELPPGTVGLVHPPHNISAGTQVVSRVEVRETKNSLVHPRGAVGVVTRTPTGEDKFFLVRFPGGFEFSLRREKLEVLKHFQARLGAVHIYSLAPTGGEGQGEGASPANPAFDLESLVIYRCITGSRADGLNHDESDTSRRGIYLAPTDPQRSLFGVPEELEDNATQSCYWELQKFPVKAPRRMAAGQSS